jgi:hypothetical protein
VFLTDRRARPNQVRAYDLIRMMMAEGRITSLGRAFAHYGRIFEKLAAGGMKISPEIRARLSPLQGNT